MVGGHSTQARQCHVNPPNPSPVGHSVDIKNIWWKQSMPVPNATFISTIFWKDQLCLPKWSDAFLPHLSPSGILLDALTKHILFAPAWVCKMAFFPASASLSKVWKQWYVVIFKTSFFFNTVRSLQRLLLQREWVYLVLSRTKTSLWNVAEGLHSTLPVFSCRFLCAFYFSYKIAA